MSPIIADVMSPYTCIIAVLALVTEIESVPDIGQGIMDLSSICPYNVKCIWQSKHWCFLVHICKSK